MTSSIIFCMNNPIKTNIDNWLYAHKGRVSVGRDLNDHYEILAYSDNESDFPELMRIARRENALYINSVISEGVTVVE